MLKPARCKDVLDWHKICMNVDGRAIAIKKARYIIR